LRIAPAQGVKQSGADPAARRIDLNADLGEGFGRWQLGEEELILPWITSASVACGFHAGDPRSIRRTLALAGRHGVAVGAHPGYPDLEAIVLGPPGSVLLEKARQAQLVTAAEGFADRAYRGDGTLAGRNLPGAVIDDPLYIVRH